MRGRRRAGATAATLVLALLAACAGETPTPGANSESTPQAAPAAEPTQTRRPRASRPPTAASPSAWPTPIETTQQPPDRATPAIEDERTTPPAASSPPPAAEPTPPPPPPPSSPAPTDRTRVEVAPAPSYPAATVAFAGASYAGVVGRNGVSDDKREGDGTTPAGCFRILRVFYRPDRLAAPETVLPTQALEPDDVWIDDPDHPRYNQLAKASELEPGVSHEIMWRDDHRYDIVLDLDYNRGPIVAGRGSAIFMHVAYDQDDPASTPTAGCVALAQADLLEVLAGARPDTSVCVRL